MRWLRYLGFVLAFFVVIFVIAGVASLIVTYRAPTIGEMYAERTAADLTAAACLKNQSCAVVKDAPIGGLAEYRRCGGVVSVARLRGQPLACSEQWATDLLLRDWLRPGESAYRQLRRGCRTHDLCYVHGRATYGHDRAQCDREFLAENQRECWLIYGNENENDYLKDRDLLRWACQARASIAYLAVRAGGKGYFENNEEVVCDYEGGPHAARDQVVSGRFLGGKRDYVISLALARDQNALQVRLLSIGADGQSQDVTDTLVVTPDKVPVGDRDWACNRRRTADGGFTADCPERLGQSAFKSATDWLRFAAIVVDADGDGSDELVIPSIVPDFGLAFTRIVAKEDSSGIHFEPVQAYLGAARMAKSEARRGGCEDQLEFSGCGADGSNPSSRLLTREAAAQNLGYQFTVAASANTVCVPQGQENKQDILLLSTFSDFPENPSHDAAKSSGWDTGYLLRRFVFDPQAQRWEMRRDRFNNDYHRLSGCSIRLSRDQFQTHARLQYPPFVVRLPPPAPAAVSTPPTAAVPPAAVTPSVAAAPAPGGSPVCPYDERLALISRDKCPTSAPVARAGSLNDVDLMLYQLKADYDLTDEKKREQYKKYNAYDEIKMAKVNWKPILWAETADPVLTSRAARENGIVMVSAFLGGTKEVGRGGDDVTREGHHPVVAVLRADQLKAKKPSWMVRYADTMGHVPDLFGIFKSSDFKVGESESIANLWDPHRFGPARMYFQIPSVLAPFTWDGKAGVSMVFFANRYLWEKAEQSEKEDFPELQHYKSEPLTVAPGHFRIKIIPLPTEASKGNETPAMFDCPVNGAAAADRAGDERRFLQHELVLAGRFLDGDYGGSLAVASRSTDGGIRLTALRYDGASETWMFGTEACMRRDQVKEGPDRIRRELFLGRLN